MSNYVITTDNNSDLPESYMEEHGIGCVFLSYSIDGKQYNHEDFLSNPEFYRLMREGSMPTTAQANPESVKEMMTTYLEKGLDILHISFSSGLSGTCNSSRIAAEELQEEYPDRKIVIVDSLAASLGEGLLVHYVLKQKENGATLEEAAKWAEDHKLNMVHLFTVDNLFHLHRGGRVSKTTAIVGSMLNIKPILHVDDEGHLTPLDKVRGRKKSLNTLFDLMDQYIGSYKDSCDTVFISHGDCQEEAEYLMGKVKERYQLNVELINYVGATIGAHSGPGTMALFFMGDHR
ncbi:MAG: DegV family protein [Eubacteriales bacterium]|nr:DegV family protein [Eubacteriales bacterium]